MIIETTEQNGSTIYRKLFEMNDEEHKRFLSLPKEEGYAWDFWYELGHKYGFDPNLIEYVKKPGQKEYWKNIEYISGTKRRKFTALSKVK